MNIVEEFKSPMSLAGALLSLWFVTVPISSFSQTREIQPVETVTLSTKQILTGELNGKPTFVAGELRIPGPGTGKLPAVILLHDSVGLRDNHDRWVKELNNAGIASFALDSYTGRKLNETNSGQLDTLAMMVDAYRALGMLAEHPRIDPNRIAVLGFSKGAAASLYSSIERFRKAYAPPNVRFAAHIGVYGFCNVSLKSDDKVTGKPIRLFHGVADDWVSIEPCRAYVARLQSAGVDATLTEYPNAFHVYDKSHLTTPRKLAQVPTLRNCLLAEGDSGDLLNIKTGQKFDLKDPCVERGVTIAYNEEATIDTTKKVTEFIKSLVP